jgi:hypothetical protein
MKPWIETKAVNNLQRDAEVRDRDDQLEIDEREGVRKRMESFSLSILHA